MSALPRVRPSVALLLASAVAAVVVAGCTTNVDVAVVDVTVITWPGDEGSTGGQVIVRVRNDADRPIDPDVLGPAA